MSRHTSRLDRLTHGVVGSVEDLESARLDRMTDEELLAEAVVEAVKFEFDPEIAWGMLKAIGLRHWRSRLGSILRWHARIARRRALV